MNTIRGVAIKVDVLAVVAQMEIQGDGTVYLNTNTGEFLLVTDEDKSAVNQDIENLPEWQRELVPEIKEALESEHYIALPDRFEIHEWKIMQHFSESQSNPVISKRLVEAIHGRKAFRSFRTELARMRLDNEWYGFREKALEPIAIRWLEENGIPYEPR